MILKKSVSSNMYIQKKFYFQVLKCFVQTKRQCLQYQRGPFSVRKMLPKEVGLSQNLKGEKQMKDCWEKQNGEMGA